MAVTAGESMAGPLALSRLVTSRFYVYKAMERAGRVYFRPMSSITPDWELSEHYSRDSTHRSAPKKPQRSGLLCLFTSHYSLHLSHEESECDWACQPAYLPLCISQKYVIVLWVWTTWELVHDERFRLKCFKDTNYKTVWF